MYGLTAPFGGTNLLLAHNLQLPCQLYGSMVKGMIVKIGF